MANGHGHDCDCRRYDSDTVEIFSRDELCILQQALNLRKSIQITCTDFTDRDKYDGALITDTVNLHQKILRMIRRENDKIKTRVIKRTTSCRCIKCKR